VVLLTSTLTPFEATLHGELMFEVTHAEMSLARVDEAVNQTDSIISSMKVLRT
jgi:hypothetical protein